MDRKEELVEKAALALADQFYVELIRRAMAADPENFVGKVKKVCEILALEDQVAASVRHAAILARDFLDEFQRITEGEKQMDTLMLREDQIHSGMLVRLFLEGKTEPERDDDGPITLQALLGAGHPHNAYLYPLKGGIQGCDGGAILDSPLTGFKPNVRFQPVHVYEPGTAPCETNYVIFVGGEYLISEGMEKHPANRVYVLKDGEGRFQNKSLCLRNGTITFHQFEFQFPKGALLVSIDEVRKLRESA
jgi:hypothetical protein